MLFFTHTLTKSPSYRANIVKNMLRRSTFLWSINDKNVDKLQSIVIEHADAQEGCSRESQASGSPALARMISSVGSSTERAGPPSISDSSEATIVWAAAAIGWRTVVKRG